MRAEWLTPSSCHDIRAPQGSRHTYTPRSHFYVVISTLSYQHLTGVSFRMHACMDSTPSSLRLALHVFISMHAFLTAVLRMND